MRQVPCSSFEPDQRCALRDQFGDVRPHHVDTEYLLTTIPFYIRVMEDRVFRSGQFTTSYVQERLPLLLYLQDRDPMDMVVSIAAAIVAHSKV